MTDDIVVALRQPGSFSADPLTSILRAGARQLLAQAIEAEVEGHIASHADLTDATGRACVMWPQVIRFLSRLGKLIKLTGEV